MHAVPAPQPVFRFAPSPNGHLHLGHALSALTNAGMAHAAGGRLLLRIEDIDLARCRPAYEAAIVEDLRWLGIAWEEPVRRQSAHFDVYRQAFEQLRAAGLVYPAFLTRGEVRGAVQGIDWPHDPDGAPHYPPHDRQRPEAERADLLAEGRPHAWRLDMEAALARAGFELFWTEGGIGPGDPDRSVHADPGAWGDVVLMRPDGAPSYHLAVTVDDALQGVTDVVRGRDLYHATSVHRLLQALLALPAPRYRHHRLMLAADGRKLSKSNGDTALSALRARGWTPEDVCAALR
ncbi:tRNA glutamyl-Q(34) synthetase GluQRS [Ensifer soli]|uniref:tRNA glutamyl-Q(34) synthetase GluQRS n=1 Tax=Ciceribacter sp. sgz301302 TaxID=3342379 RepID=UPI0035B89C5D